MNKQFVAAVTSIAMVASSCVSTPKSERYVASEPDSKAFTAIAEQGLPAQVVKTTSKGKDYDFTNKPFITRQFKMQDIQSIASAYDVKLSAGQLMTDNDLAFETKLRVIESAQKELRMVYFIYADDDSSSKLNSALIAKAKAGVKVKLLVDFITNYKNLDLFTALNKMSNGNIVTYFYNFPSTRIFWDANYMTMPCPKGVPANDQVCRDHKMQELAKIGDEAAQSKPTAFGKLFLTGIYGKSAAALKAAIGLGAQINPEDYKSKSETSDEDKQAMLDLAEIALGALKGNIIDRIKLSIAMSMYGEKINPILNEFNGRLPVGIEKDKGHTEVWDHLTDYTHHKLIIADNSQFVLGGRNVEDSYHMKKRVGSNGKYIFMDTDFWGQADLRDGKGAKEIAQSFDRLAESSMVVPMSTVKSYLAYDFVANTGASKNEIGAAQRAVGFCMQEAQNGNPKAIESLGGCILSYLPSMPGYRSEDARVADVVKNMKTNYERYQSAYKSSSKENPFGRLSANDLKTASFHYLENVNYERGNNQNRVTGSRVGYESYYNKNIQAAWYRGLENVCKESRDKNKDMKVIFHTAYFLMPSGMIHRLAQMMNNDFGDCSRVSVTFITNSPFTTDLAPINVLARYQLGALFDHYKNLVDYKKQFEAPVVKSGDSYVPASESDIKSGRAVTFTYKQFWPKLEYYEYTPSTIQELASLTTKPDSLHTKTTLLGNDLVVGSANSDVRSYYMDTNNAILIRDAEELVAQYTAMVERLKTSGRIVDRMTSFQGKTFDMLKAENNEFLVAGAKRWKQEKRLTPEVAASILGKLDDAGRFIYGTTRSLLTYRGEFDAERAKAEGNVDLYKKNQELNDNANKMDNLFKVF